MCENEGLWNKVAFWFMVLYVAALLTAYFMGMPL